MRNKATGMLETIAIVGASLAGARAAEALRNKGFEGEVLLIGEEALRPYERPPLSKESLTQSDAEPLWVHPSDFYSQADITLRLGERVVALQRGSRFQLQLAGGDQLQADAVLLATGGKPRKLPNVPGSSRVHYLRDWEDAMALKRMLAPEVRVAVVGSGFIGAEVASSAATLGCEVNIIEALSIPFPAVVADEVKRTLTRSLEDSGMRITASALVSGIEEHADGVTIATSQGNFEADLVVVGIGIEPASELAESAGATVDRGVIVDHYYRTSIPGLYAAGDVATRVDASGHRTRTEHWRSAQEQGVAAAAAILGEEPPELMVPWCWSDQLGHRLEVAGDPGAGDQQVIRCAGESELCVFHLSSGRLVGATGLNARREIRAAMKLIGQNAHPDPTELANPACPVKKVPDLQVPAGGAAKTSGSVSNG